MKTNTIQKTSKSTHRQSILTTKRLAVATSLLVFSMPAQAASIIIVEPDRDATINASWDSYLTGLGHSVTAYTGGGKDGDPLTATEKDTLNAADLIIFTSGHGSGGAGTAADWNGLTTSLIAMDAYSVDGPVNGSGDWGWFSGTGGSTQNITVQNDAVDALWSGVTFSNPLDIADANLRLSNATIQFGGTIVASNGSNTVIARWGAGDLAEGGGARMFFAGTNGQPDMDLNATGQILFSNAIDSLVVPEPSSALLSGIGILMLLSRRRA